MFYTSTVSSVSTFGSACWGGNVAKQDKDRLEKKHQKGRRDSRWKARKSPLSLPQTIDGQTEYNFG